MSWSYWENNRDFAAMLGLTLISVTGLEPGSESVEFKTKEGRRFRLEHISDCCESVRIVDVCGDIADLIGEPLLVCEEASNAARPAEYPAPEYMESETWTFYRLATRRGFVVIRWLGESNGYYGETAWFHEFVVEGEAPVTTDEE
jgi:hypothetical protein